MHMDEESQQALRAFVERSVRFQWPGILVLAWTGRRTFASLFSALDAVFERPSRSFAKGNLVALAMVTLTGVGVLATMAFSMALAAVEGALRRLAGESGSHLFQGLRRLPLDRRLPGRGHLHLLLHPLPLRRPVT